MPWTSTNNRNKDFILFDCPKLNVILIKILLPKKFSKKQVTTTYNRKELKDNKGVLNVP